MLSALELDMIAKQMASIVTPLIAQIKTLEDRLASMPVPREGKDGESVTIDQIQPLILEAVKAIPAPKDGVDGKDGTSVTLEQLEPLVSATVAKAVEALPVPKDGLDGKDGVSITLDQIQPLILEAVKAIPAPVNGVDGKDGTSVTLEQLAPLVDETVAKAVSALPVPKDGVDGVSITLDQIQPLILEAVKAIPAPVNGVDGKDGTSVTLEQLAPLVDETVAKAVSAIPVPKDGVDGRDATHLEILPGIVETKSYLRDSWATHDGGLWRAHSNTEGMRGWECVVDGVKSIDVVQIDERTATVTVVKASGQSQEIKMAIPAMVYKGVYREGDRYERGDTATWAGSLWHCEKDGVTSKPGTTEGDWKLTVKRGNNGKDGVNGIDKTATVKMQ